MRSNRGAQRKSRQTVQLSRVHALRCRFDDNSWGDHVFDSRLNTAAGSTTGGQHRCPTDESAAWHRSSRCSTSSGCRDSSDNCSNCISRELERSGRRSQLSRDPGGKPAKPRVTSSGSWRSSRCGDSASERRHGDEPRRRSQNRQRSYAGRAQRNRSACSGTGHRFEAACQRFEYRDNRSAPPCRAGWFTRGHPVISGARGRHGGVVSCFILIPAAEIRSAERSSAPRAFRTGAVDMIRLLR